MIEVKNQFANHGIFWAFVAPFVITLLMPMAFLPSVFMISANEVSFFTSVGSDERDVTAKADKLYLQMFVKPGITNAFENLFASKITSTKQTPLGIKSNDFTRKWNDGFWHMLYRAIWRLVALMPIYAACIFAFVIPSFVDGIVTRGKKRFNYEVHNPVLFYSFTHFSVLVLGLAVFIPFLPLDLNAMYIGAFVIVLAGSMWMLASNFQTGS